MFKRIMIAYDGSKEAGKALACAISLARSLDAAVIIVTVLEALPSYTVFISVVSPNLPQQLKDEKQKQLLALQKTALQIAIDHKVRATAVLVDGEEVAGIVEAAAQNHADLLVIGLRKHPAFAPFGTTARQVARRSPCPLLAVN